MRGVVFCRVEREIKRGRDAASPPGMLATGGVGRRFTAREARSFCGEDETTGRHVAQRASALLSADMLTAAVDRPSLSTLINVPPTRFI